MMSTPCKAIYAGLSMLALLLAFPAYSGAVRPEEVPFRKIVVFKGELKAVPAQAAAIAGAGGRAIKPLRLVNGFAAMLPVQAQAALAKRAEVERIDDDIVVTALARKPKPQIAESLPWGVDNIDAEWVWGGAENATAVAPGAVAGEFVKVAVMDTGIDLTHPDLAANIKGNVNTINPLKSGNDDNNHGSHVAGIIAGVDNQIGVIGVAPKAYLYAVKVLGSSGSGWLSDIIEGLDWCIGNGIQVINMSFGASADNLSFHQAITTAYNAGITMAAAAGNSGTAGISYPARYPETIAVAATDANNTMAYYSSYGPEMDIAAPGTSVFSTLKGGGYGTMSGTSMATPHVAGTAALVLYKYGPLSPDAVRTHLMETAQDLGFAADRQGAGLVDAQHAVETAP